MDILIRHYTAKPRFKPHYNTATGRYYHTRDEYVSDLKKRGLEPYRPEQASAPKQKPYRPSEWAREMVRTIQRSKRADGTVRLGDRFHEALATRGVNMRDAMSAQLPEHYRREVVDAIK